MTKGQPKGVNHSPQIGCRANECVGKPTDRSVRILHVIIGLGVGGAERSLVRLIGSHEHVPRYRHHIVNLTGRDDLQRHAIDAGATVRRLDLSSAAGKILVLGQLTHEIRRYRPDVVHCWMYHADFLGGLAARICGVRKILWGVRNTSLGGNSRFKRLFRKTCAVLSPIIPTAIVCVGEAVREVHEKIGYDRHKMIVIPNGYDLDEVRFDQSAREKVRKEFGILPNEILVGSVGRLSPAKDHMNLLKAAAMAVAQVPSLKFVLVGRGVDDDQDIRKLLVDKGLVGRVKLLGERDDVIGCLSAMDIFCLHSKTEGFPNALAEAMAVERPCVATDVGDSRLMLEGLAGVVPVSDPCALASAIVQLSSMPQSKREALGSALRARLADRYSMSYVVSRYEGLYGDA